MHRIVENLSLQLIVLNARWMKSLGNHHSAASINTNLLHESLGYRGAKWTNISCAELYFPLPMDKSVRGGGWVCCFNGLPAPTDKHRRSFMRTPGNKCWRAERPFLTTNSLLGKELTKCWITFWNTVYLWNKAVICMDDTTAKVSQTGGTLAWAEEVALMNVDLAFTYFSPSESEKKTPNSFT